MTGAAAAGYEERGGVLDGPSGAHPPAMPLETLLQDAQFAERRAQRDVARDLYEVALRRLGGPADAATASALLRWIGRTYLNDGDHEAALDCLEAALAVAEASGDGAAIAHGVNLTAIARQQRGEVDEAELLYRRALITARGSGEGRLAAMIQQNLGTIANIRGDLRLALKHYHASLTAYRELGLDQYVGPLLSNLGMLYTDLRRWHAAERAYDDAEAACRASGDVSARIMIDVNRAELQIARRQFAKACESCDRAFELASQVGDGRVLGETYKHYGVVFRETGHPRLAEEHLARAAELAAQRADLLLAAETAREQAELFHREDRHRDTLQALNHAHRCFATLRAEREVADIGRRMARLEGMFVEIVRKWSDSIESKDHYTQGHCERVADYACALADATGIDAQTLFWFRLGALLHDVGKIVVPKSVLNKPGPLTPEEREIMMSHPAVGVELLAGIEFPWDVRPMVRHHHERWDGAGYPDGLAGHDIPLAARILCIADVFDALTTSRAYRQQAFSPERALEIMAADAGLAFDAELFALFTRALTTLPEPASKAHAVGDAR